MLLILGCAILLGGVGLFGIGKLKQSPEEDAREREQAAASAAKMREALEEGRMSGERLAHSADRMLQHARPGTGSIVARLVTGLFVAITLYAIGREAIDAPLLAALLLVVPIVYSLWRDEPRRVIRNLLIANVAGAPLLLALLIMGSPDRVSGYAEDEGFITSVALGIMLPVFISLVALAVLWVRRRPQAEEHIPSPPAEAGERPWATVSRKHVIIAASVLAVLSLLFPPHQLPVWDDGGVMAISTVYRLIGTAKEPLAASRLLLQFAVIGMLVWPDARRLRELEKARTPSNGRRIKLVTPRSRSSPTPETPT